MREAGIDAEGSPADDVFRSGPLPDVKASIRTELFYHEKRMGEQRQINDVESGGKHVRKMIAEYEEARKRFIILIKYQLRENIEMGRSCGEF